jgi:hypothetical protein
MPYNVAHTPSELANFRRIMSLSLKAELSRQRSTKPPTGHRVKLPPDTHTPFLCLPSTNTLPLFALRRSQAQRPGRAHRNGGSGGLPRLLQPNSHAHRRTLSREQRPGRAQRRSGVWRSQRRAFVMLVWFLFL